MLTRGSGSKTHFWLWLFSDNVQKKLSKGPMVFAELFFFQWPIKFEYILHKAKIIPLCWTWWKWLTQRSAEYFKPSFSWIISSLTRKTKCSIKAAEQQPARHQCTYPPMWFTTIDEVLWRYYIRQLGRCIPADNTVR